MSNRYPVAKAQPTFTEVHVNRPLTDLSLAYLQQESDFVASKVFPIVGTAKASDNYFSYPKAWWLKAFAEPRGVGAPAPVSGYQLDTATFNATRISIAKEIADPIRNQADIADLDAEAVRWLNQQLMLKMEVDWAAKYFVTGVWGTSTTPSILWDDAASTPIEDVRTAKRTIKTNTGQNANKLVMGAKLFDNLLDHPDIIDRIKYGQTPGAPAMANEQIMAKLFGVDEVLVCRGVQNTAGEGTAVSLSFIAGSRNALLVHAAPSPGLLTPSAGYTFAWQGAPGANAAGMVFKSFRDERRESDVIEGNAWYDQKLVASDLGYAFINAVAA